MKRGLMANTLSPTIWIHEEVLLTNSEDGGVQAHRLDWLWRVSCRFSPIIISSSAGSPLLSDYHQRVFSQFSEARAAFIQDMRAVLFVVNRPEHAAPPEIVLFDKSTGT